MNVGPGPVAVLSGIVFAIGVFGLLIRRDAFGLLVSLAGSVGPQGSQSRGVQGDRAPAPFGLWLAHLGDAVNRYPGPTNADGAGLHVDVGPLQAESLAAAQAGRGQQAPQAEEAVLGDVTEEGDQLLARPSRQIAAFAAPLGTM